MSTVTLRNVNPLGFTDCPEIGRVGDGPVYGECRDCVLDPTSDHEHELLNPDALEPGSGCLVPGEEFEVEAELAEKLLELVGIFELADPDDGLGDLTIAALQQHAIDHGIDLGDAKKKPAILAAIRKG